MEELKCDSGGGIVLVDRDVLARLKRLPPTEELDYAESLSVAVDVDGKTDQIYRWPDEPWGTVWKRETTPLVEKINTGELAMVVFHEGIFVCDIDATDRMVFSGNGREMRLLLYVPSGMLVIAELEKLAEDWEVIFPTEHDSFAQREISVSPGWYDVVFWFPANVQSSKDGRRWRFGSIDQPACIIRILPSVEGRMSVTELFRVRFPV